MSLATIARRVLLICVTCLLAALAWRGAATAYWLEVAPQSAPSVLRSDERLALASERQTLLRTDDVPVSIVRMIAEQSTRSLLEEPLDPIGLRQIGLARMWLEDDGGEAFLLMAQRLSRRDAGTQVALFNLAASRSDFPAALDHLDLIFTQYPRVGGELLPYLAGALGQPAFRGALRKYRDRPWVAGLLSSSVDGELTSGIVAQAMLELDIRASAAEPGALHSLIERLLADGDFATARQVAIRLGDASPAALEDFGFSPATTSPTSAPLTWYFPSSEVARTAYDGRGGIAIDIDAATSDQLAWRVTSLPPGSYRLTFDLAQRSELVRSAVEWQVACAADGGPAKTIWRERYQAGPGGRSIAADLALPVGCPVQHWQFRASSGEWQLPLRLRLSDLRLEPLP